MVKIVQAILIAILTWHSAVHSHSIRVKGSEDKKMVCYYGSWSTYRWGNGKFDVENIDPFVCSHLIYTFAGLGSNGTIISLDPYNDLYDEWGKGAFERFTGLKKRNPALKTLIAIGGWNEGSLKYSQMAADAEKRSKFIKSVLDFLIKYNFDGLDFDWEYPANRGGATSDKQTFISLIAELKAAFQPHGFLLTAAVACPKNTVDAAYDIPAMSRIMDQIHLMCYDFQGAWNTFTGHNAPLYANPAIDSEFYTMNNVDFSVRYWLQSGAAASKLILGMPLYGRGFTLDNANNHGFYAAASQPIQAGPFTGEAGFWGYNEACEKFKNEQGWTFVHDDVYQVPYAYKDNAWIGYDNQKSLIAKAEYANSMGLGGAMVWSIETDDFLGICHGERFALTKTILKAIHGGSVPVFTTPSPTPSTQSSSTMTTTTPALEKSTTTPTHSQPTPIATNPATDNKTSSPVTPPSPTGKPLCQSTGFMADSSNCAVFYQCTKDTKGNYIVYKQSCAPGTVFSAPTNSCDWPNRVEGCH